MPSNNKAVPLQRGSACLCCRKRKMRCDGVRPSCSQCIKGNRAETCDFDDRHRRSRTQILQEKLSLLERKLQKLEDSPTQSPTFPEKVYQQVQHAQPYAPDNAHNQGINPSATSMFNFPTLTFDTLAPSNFLTAFEPFDITGLPGTFPESMFDFLQPNPPSRSSTPSEVAPNSEHRSGPESPNSSHQGAYDSPHVGVGRPSEQELLAIFLTHCHQCSFQVDTNRIQSGDGQRHPALMNAIYLSACYFSQSPWFAELETHFLGQTLNAITAGLEHSDRLIDIVSALCLVAVYQYANCRISEGYRHSFAAARLVITLGLHQIPGTESQDFLLAVIPPARDSKELRDRISIFWQVYSVDRCWSVAYGLPIALPGEHASETLKIKTPLPRPSTPGTPFIPALRAEAVTLYERAYRVSSSSFKDDVFRAERQELGQALDQFSSTVPPFFRPDYSHQQPPGIDVDLLIIHTMVNVAYIYLQRDHLGKCMSASELCLKAAHTISSHIRQLKEEDYQFLDPIISACWKTVGKLYIHLIVISNKSSNRAREIHGVARELNVLIFALKKLGNSFPIAGQDATMLEKERTDKCCSSGSGSSTYASPI